MEADEDGQESGTESSGGAVEDTELIYRYLIHTVVDQLFRMFRHRAGRVGFKSGVISAPDGGAGIDLLLKMTLGSVLLLSGRV